MKIKKKTTLAEALDEVAKIALAVKSSGVVIVDGHEFRPENEVHLEIEFEVGKSGAELEFEIKWKRKTLVDQAKGAVGLG